ncbi:hypothetical protein FACS189490_02780 [Clostridia bacterium]|nr:hypothetical protein FACS189490_02780 [Clostridia bacterium]
MENGLAAKHNIAVKIFWLIITVVMSWSLIVSVVSPTILTVTHEDALYSSVIFSVIFAVVFFNKKTFLAALIVFGVMFLLFFASVITDKTTTEAYTEFFINVMKFMRGDMAYSESYDRAVSGFIRVAIPLLISVAFIRPNMRILYIIVISVGEMVLSAGYGFDEPFAVAVFIFAAGAGVASELNGFASERDNPAFNFVLLTVVFLCTAVSYVAPRTNTEQAATWMQKNLIYPAQEAFMEKRFVLESTGFGKNDGTLGGDAFPEKDALLAVYSPGNISGMLLAGARQDYYSGNSWRNSVGSKSEELDSRLSELFSMSKATVSAMLDLSATVQIRFLMTSTTTVFAPSYFFGVAELDGTQMKLFKDKGDNITASNIFRRDDGYVIYNLYNSAFASSSYFTTDVEKYKQIPESFPQRVADLAEQITKNASQPQNKAINLQSFLKKNYDYTLTPGDTPPGVDFVDYFLFEQKKGYCAYFATAFVMMCRSIGLPARYVTGFTVPPGMTDAGEHIITGENAHAWAEVYFEGTGWTTFNPTGFSDTAIVGARTEASSASSPASAFPPQSSSGATPPPIPGQFESELEEIGVSPASTVKPNQADTTKNSLWWNWLRFLAGIFVLLLIAAIRMLHERVMIFNRGRKAKKRGANAVVVYSFERIISYAKYFHYPLLKNETAEEYSIRVGKVFSFENDSLFMRDLVKVFNRAKYGESEVSERDRKTMENAYESLCLRFRQNLGETRFKFVKYFLRTENKCF